MESDTVESVNGDSFQEQWLYREGEKKQIWVKEGERREGVIGI